MRSVFRLLFRTRVTVCLAFTPNLSEFQGILTVLSRRQAAKAHLLCEVFWGNREGGGQGFSCAVGTQSERDTVLISFFKKCTAKLDYKCTAKYAARLASYFLGLKIT